MSSITREQILAGLKKVGPCSPGALAAHLGVDYGSSYMKQLVARMTVDNEIKAIGNRKSRRIALPDQEFTEAEAPPPAAPRAEAAQEQEGDEQGAQDAGGTARADHRALHPHRRRRAAPAHHQRRCAG